MSTHALRLLSQKYLKIKIPRRSSQAAPGLLRNTLDKSIYCVVVCEIARCMGWHVKDMPKVRVR